MPTKLLQASRFISHSVLLSIEDLDQILTLLGCQVCNISKVVEKIDYKDELLSSYRDYVADFEKGDVFLPNYRANLACALTCELSCLNVQNLNDNRLIIRPILPIIQVGLFTFGISSEGKLLSGALGASTRSYGLQFSFPALFRDPITGKNGNALKEGINAPMWKTLTKWIRNETHLLKIKHGHEMIASTLRASNSLDNSCIASL